jgi:prolyl-tRNA synthetase
VANAARLLDEMQNGLFQRAKKLRQENTRVINNADEFREFFTPQNAENPEIHGGFALCHWCESDELHRLLADLKVTIRCLPMDPELADGEGPCFLTGRPGQQRAVFGKAY